MSGATSRLARNGAQGRGSTRVLSDTQPVRPDLFDTKFTVFLEHIGRESPTGRVTDYRADFVANSIATGLAFQRRDTLK